MTGSIWYVAYGSNMAADRFRCYVEGGTPAGGVRSYPGCRDTTWPAEDRGVLIPGAVYFAAESLVWTGGMAFYDPSGVGHVPARAWLVTRPQFADILSQEMHREVGDEVDFAALRPGVPFALGPGRYETLVHIGDLDGRAMLTFTAPWRPDEIEHARPSAAYLGVLTRGLAEAHGWDEHQAGTYLRGLSW